MISQITNLTIIVMLISAVYPQTITQTHAYPADELMPLTCKGRVRGEEMGRGDIDYTLGRFSLTLIDTLDTLAVSVTHTHTHWLFSHPHGSIVAEEVGCS